MFNSLFWLAGFAQIFSVKSICLSKDDLASLNVTALDAILKPSNSTICKKIWTAEGQCATEDSVLAAIKALKLTITKNALLKIDKIAKTVKTTGDKLKNLANNAIQYKKNSTTTAKSNTPAKQTAGEVVGQAQNATATNATNATNPTGKKPKIDKAKLNLNDNVINKLERLQKKLNDTQAQVGNWTDKGRRQACFQAQFRIVAGSFCAGTSGAGSTYAVKNSNGQITGFSVNFAVATELIKFCGHLIMQTCTVTTTQDILNTAVGGTAPATSAAPTFCSDLAALETCVNIPADCPNDLKKAIVEQGFSLASFKLTDSIDTTAIEANAADVDESLASSRRLAVVSASPSYSVETNGADAATIGAESGVSDAAVETEASVSTPTLDSAAAWKAFIIIVLGVLLL